MAKTSSGYTLSGIACKILSVIVPGLLFGVAFLHAPSAYATSATWTDDTSTSSANGQYWYWVSASADGSKALATSEYDSDDINPNGGLWVTSDSGNSWTDYSTSTGITSWQFGYVSPNGQNMVASSIDYSNNSVGDVWVSTNSGVTWANRTSGFFSSRGGLNSLSCSTSTQVMAVVTLSPANVWVSSNNGVSWTNTTASVGTNKSWEAVSVSQDGTRIVAAESGGDIWISTNGGTSWTDKTVGSSAANQNWGNIYMSADGSKIAVAAGSAGVWTSTSSGTTWTQRKPVSSPYVSVVTGATDGSELFADEGNSSKLFESADFGVSWTDITTSTPAAGKNWRGIASNSDASRLYGVENGTQDIWTFGTPPTVPALTVQSASSVGTSSATLNGTMTSDGGASATAIGFNYGTTTAYGRTASTTGTYGSGPYSISITGLSPNITYHYQAFATNGQGTGTSSDQTFVTFANLPTITLQSATAVATSSATLNATILNDGNASSTNKGFIYGTTTSYGSLINLSGSYGEGAFSSGISNLIPNTTYHYVAFVTNSAGTATSTDGTLTTSATSSAVSGCGTYVYTSGNTTYQVTCGITTVLSVAPSSTGSTGGGSGGGASVTGSNTTSTVVAVNLGPVYSVTPVLAPITVSVATTTISLPADTSSPTSTLAVVPTVATSTPDQAMMPIAACPVGYTCIPATGLSDSSSIAPSSVIPAGAAASHAGTSAGGTPAASVSFGGNLQLGSSGSDVKQLQAFLNIHGFPVSSSGAGSTGHETSYFGPATKAALAKFQKANGIRPAVGYFGPITRSYVNAS